MAQFAHQLQVTGDLFDDLNAFLRYCGHPEIVAAMLWTQVPSQDRSKNQRYDYKPYGKCFPCGTKRAYESNMGSHLGKCENVKKYLAENVYGQQVARVDPYGSSYIVTPASRHRDPIASTPAGVPRSSNSNGAPVIHNDFVPRPTGVAAPRLGTNVPQGFPWPGDGTDLIGTVGDIIEYMGDEESMLAEHMFPRNRRF
ncbi:hypothetical protein C1H76_6974 [Elsinoe australis]|uniref:Uncharacterized protein n=1 Tax=Elsinoe australis TaxID=40998 RepID=A0A4U7B0T8_9PEZI|nr:hypothetical protein C1H76_6974 [Elsinoe australis]